MASREVGAGEDPLAKTGVGLESGGSTEAPPTSSGQASQAAPAIAASSNPQVGVSSLSGTSLWGGLDVQGRGALGDRTFAERG